MTLSEQTVGEWESEIADAMAAHAVPGVSVAVVNGGETVWAAGLGWADRERTRHWKDTEQFRYRGRRSQTARPRPYR